MTATLKINPARLPDRGQPTKDLRPVFAPPEGARIVVIERPKPVIKRKRKQANRKDLWTFEQDETALQMWLEHRSYEEIAEAVGRGVDATYSRLCRIRKEKHIPGIRPRNGQKGVFYSPEDDRLIIKMHNEGHEAGEIAKALGRSVRGIKCRMSGMRKKGIILTDHRLERER